MLAVRQFMQSKLGTYVPNTEVALNLARELEVSVDELFSLQAADLKSPGLSGH